MKKLLSACLVALIGLVGVTAQNQSPSFQFVPGEALDVTIGLDGVVWIIGTTPLKEGGYGIFKKTLSGWQELNLDAVVRSRYGESGAVKVAIDPDGNPWIVTASSHIYRWVRNAWEFLGGDFKDVGIGANGAVWAIGTNAEPYTWVGSQWVHYFFDKLPCAANNGYGDYCQRVSVDSNGDLYILDDKREIYKSTGMLDYFAAIQRGSKDVSLAWTRLPGLFTDISVGAADNSVFAVSSVPYRGGGQVFKWAATDWNPLPVGGTDVAVDIRGFPWLVNSSYKILTDSSNSEPATLKDTILAVNAPWLQNKNALALSDAKFSPQFGGTVSFSLDFTNQNLTPIALQYNLSDLVKLESNGKTYTIGFGQNSKCSSFSETVAPGATVRLKCTSESEGAAVFGIADTSIKEFVVSIAALGGIQNARWLVPVKR